MNKLSIDEIRDKQLYILSYIDEVCTKYNLRYSLAGGTLLGAIRHKGYIPWDDDIDIMMPRDDYNIMLEHIRTFPEDLDVYSCHEEQNVLDKNFAKISLKGTKVIEPNLEIQIDIGINIDIFPIDGLSNNIFIAKYRFFKLRVLRFLFDFKSLHTSKRIYGIPVKPFQRLLQLISMQQAIKMINSEGTIDSLDDSSFAVSVGSAYLRKEFTEKSLYSSYRAVLFEGKEYKSITEYDKYLKMMYGNYMAIPDESKRISHNYIAYSLDDVSKI